MVRLETLSADLVRKLKHAAPTVQRAVAVAACKFAVINAKVAHPAIRECLDELCAERTTSAAKKSDIESLGSQLDARYLSLHEAAEEGQASTDDYLQVFGEARAVSAILSALKDNPFEAATEAIYEAAAVTDDPEDLFSIVSKVLEQSP